MQMTQMCKLHKSVIWYKYCKKKLDMVKWVKIIWKVNCLGGQDIWTNLLMQIEEFAKKENLTGVRMETWDFQARGFYEKNGYTVFAEIKDCPPKTTCYFLKKNTK